METLRKYPVQEASSEDKACWARALGYSTTPEGLILPNQDIEARNLKIAETISEVAKRIAQAKAQGQHIIYLPGTYDLVHVGHLSYILQAVNLYLSKNWSAGRKINRDNLFVVALADSDNLTSFAKSHKHISNGGSEELQRPIEKGDFAPKDHPRLIALATLPVDCVGFLPGPLDANLPKPFQLDQVKAQELLRKLALNPSAKDKMVSAIADYSKLVDRVKTGRLDFGSWWYIELWQLYLTLSLTLEQSHVEPTPFENQTRILSKSDSSYFDQAAAICAISNMGAVIMNDVIATSTTQLIKEYGAFHLLESKAKLLYSANEI